MIKEYGWDIYKFLNELNVKQCRNAQKTNDINCEFSIKFVSKIHVNMTDCCTNVNSTPLPVYLAASTDT